MSIDVKQLTMPASATPDRAAAMRSPFSTTLYASPDEVEAAGIHGDWQRLVFASDSPRAMFQSPQWWDHVCATQRDQSSGVFVIRDSAGDVAGVVPLCRQEVKLDYSVKTSSVWATRLRAIEVLGGEPMMPPDAQLFDELLTRVVGAHPECDCISLEMTPTDSFCWRYLNESPLVREQFLLYVPDGVGHTRLARLPSTFDAYLAKFKSKNRFNLKKKVRLLREHGGGALRLDRYESPDEVEPFLAAGAPVALSSWQHAAAGERIAVDGPWTRKLTDLAQRGMFRGYVLACGEKPCAFVLGYQYGGVYHYVQPGYDPSFAELAPGIVMLYVMIEDLIVHRPATLLSFGYGDSDYKQMFGNSSSLDASVLLLRRRLKNRWRRASHAAFRSAVRGVKSRMRGGDR